MFNHSRMFCAFWAAGAIEDMLAADVLEDKLTDDANEQVYWPSLNHIPIIVQWLY